MAKNNSAKGNPASKRMSNTHRKAHRAELWAKGEKRKEQRRADAEARHAANVAAGTSPWEEAKAKRAANR